MPDSKSTTIASFGDLGLDSDIRIHLDTKMDIREPTRIQRKGIPALLQDSYQPGSGPKIPRDVFLQAETGSGKTLTYLLPIIHRLIVASTRPESTNSGNHTKGSGGPSRALGTFAIIMAPTRELAKQIFSTLEALLNMKLTRGQRFHWIVPGIVNGGENKSSEKNRLRKGATVLVSTPGRLLDHLQNTQSFKVEHLKWLVLDEADRLLELGFEETLKKTLAILDERKGGRRNDKNAGAWDLSTVGCDYFLRSPALPRSRITVLCSATLPTQVRRLAGATLSNPKTTPGGSDSDSNNDNDDDDSDDEPRYTAPSQLKQSYIEVPAKQRLVALTAPDGDATVPLIDDRKPPPCNKVIIFVSSCDSVDFHHALLSRAPSVRKTTEAQASTTNQGEHEEDGDEEEADDDADDNENTTPVEPVALVKKNSARYNLAESSLLLPGVHIYRLHGNLPQAIRTDTFFRFSQSKAPAVLVCTDVAARGLDLPNVQRIIQFDPPTEVADYVHRIGRTARIGRQGEALLFLLPSEMEYLKILKQQGLSPIATTLDQQLRILAQRRRRGREIEVAATDLQMACERWVAGPAQAAYLSSVRAYATHPSKEKHIFHVKQLHLGHMAKAFALQGRPTAVGSQGSKAHAQGKAPPQLSQSKKAHARQRDQQGGEGHETGRPVNKPAQKKMTNPFKRGVINTDEFSSGDITALKGPKSKKRRA
ncbi:P-loop containing nucleoside triphosphate hydrolase protein [Dimargaris cristalligena]|uniref:ATP-dependent RNA helicase n=1 Tax=Dimargaris cristalligena TaxID=215637 RepID=A0A4Q0A4H3_9FUNG|nr:P-loop containing nucleoside triphosphate hydrolase protein [Dimargaris cristalligena]|eukprot:RKP40302.1 P-loop containing nucleoside triphosphate hydrolase protein [Dimargaris cristalligena]